MYKLGLEKIGTRDQIDNIHRRSSKNLENSRKISAWLTVFKPLTVWIATNWKTLQGMGVPDHLTCLLRILYAGQEAKQQLEPDMVQWTGSKLGKEYVKAVHFHPAYYLICRVHHWARLDEVQSGIRIAGRNSNNLRYSDDTILVAESKAELKSLLRVKEEWKSWLKTQHAKI